MVCDVGLKCAQPMSSYGDVEIGCGVHLMGVEGEVSSHLTSLGSSRSV